MSNPGVSLLLAKKEQYAPDPSEPERSSWLDRFRLPSYDEMFDRIGERFDDWWARRQERKAGRN